MIPAIALPAALETAKAFGRSWWKALVGAAVVAPAAFLLGQCDGARTKAAKIENATMRRDAPLREKAAAERLNDTLSTASRAQEARNVVAQVPDGRPSAGSNALMCQRMRDAGRAVPAECGRPDR